MCQRDLRYEACAAAAAEIVNLHVGSDAPKAVVFGRVLFVILETVKSVEREMAAARLEPGQN